MKRLLILGALLLWSAVASAGVIKTIQAGATDQTVTIKIIDATDGTPELGVVFNTSGIDLEYWRHGANAVVDITEVTQTINGAHTDGGFVEIGHGHYRLDLPDAAVAAGVTAVEVQGTVTGMIVLGGTVVLSTDTPQTGDSFARIGAPVGASISADLQVIDQNVDDVETDTADMQPKLGTFSDLGSGATLAGNLEDMRDDGTAVYSRTTDSLQAVRDNMGTAQTGDAYARLGAPAGASVSADIAAAKADTAAILDDTGTSGVLISSSATNCRAPLGCSATGTLSGTHDATTADLGTNAPGATSDMVGKTLVIPAKYFARAITAYNTTTGVATFASTGLTLTDGDVWYLWETAPGGGDVNVTTIEGTDATDVLGTAQTGDAYARLGAPAGASVSADIAAVKVDTAAILVDTGTTLQAELDGIQADTEDLQTRVPAALVSGRMDASVGAMAADVLTAAATASDFGTEVGTATWASTTRLLTAGTNIVLDKGTGITGFNDLSAAQVNAEVDTALADIHLDHLFATDYDPASKPGTATALLNELVESDAGVSRFSANALEQAPTGGGETLDAIADAVWDELLSGHAVSGSTGEALSNASSAGDPWATALPGAYGAGTAGNILGNRLDAAITTRASQTSVDTVDDFVDTEIADIQARLPAALVSGRMDATVDGTGMEAGAVSAIQSGLATGAAVSALDTKLGTPAGASMSADIAAAKSDTAAILVDTAEIGVAGAGLTAADDAVLAAIAALNDLASTDVRDLIIEDQGGGVSLGCALAVLLAYASGDIVTSGTTTTYEEPSGTETRTTGTVTSAGNRTATITCPSY